jgi:PKHD-type hydroxylase
LEHQVLNIAVIDNVLTAQELAEVCSLMAKAKWEDGKRTAGDQSVQVKHNQQLPETAPQVSKARAMVSQALARSAQFVARALPKTVFPPLFNRYSGEHNFFGNHIDNAVRTFAPTARHVRTDLSATLFLSPPQSYEGGELIIEDGLGGRSVKLNAGDLVLYSATTVHRVAPVTKGERVASFFWIESMIRRDDQRLLLYEMDMAILALRQRVGDGAETVRLTGCYHNLLRMWADVGG